MDSRKIFFFTLVLAVILSSVSGGLAQDTEFSPEEQILIDLVENMYTTMATLDSYRFESKTIGSTYVFYEGHTQQPDAIITVRQNSRGDVVIQDDGTWDMYTFIEQLSETGVADKVIRTDPLVMETLWKDGESYMRSMPALPDEDDLETKPWLDGSLLGWDTTDARAQSATVTGLYALRLDILTDIQESGKEIRGDQALRIITLTMAIGQADDERFFEDAILEQKLWIGIEDNRLYRVEARVIMSQEEGEQKLEVDRVTTTQLYGFNESVDIIAPELDTPQ